MSNWSEEARLRLLEKAKEANDIIALDDGFYYYWVHGKGALSAWNLRCIADELDRMNEPLQRSIEEYFATNGQQREESDGEETGS